MSPIHGWEHQPKLRSPSTRRTMRYDIDWWNPLCETCANLLPIALQYTSTKSIFTMNAGGLVDLTVTFLSSVTPGKSEGD